VIDRLKRVLVGRGTARGLCECRHCGTTVDDRRSACPTCGSNEVAHYDV